VPESAREVVQDIALDPGQVLHGKLLDPEGKPVGGETFIAVAGDGNFQLYRSGCLTDAFEILHYFPNVTRFAYFYNKDRKLAGKLILKGPQQDGLTVRLQPAATLTGRLVDPDGKPLAGAYLSPKLSWWSAKEGDWATLSQPSSTDKEGRFRIEGLLPGAKYNVDAAREVEGGNTGSMPQQAIFDATVQAGETKDLGDLVLDPAKAPNR
jgi:hypothetical protein